MRELNDRYLKTLKPPESGRTEHSDTRRPGLRLRISAHGRAVWMFEKRVKGGKKRKHRLGTYCTWTPGGQRTPVQMGLAEAREQALILEAEATQGIDRVLLNEERKLAEEAARKSRVTTDAALEAYNSLHLANLRTGPERHHQLKLALAPVLLKDISTVTAADIQNLVDQKAQTGRLIAANRMLAGIAAFISWCWRRGYVEENFAARIPKPTKERIRDRVIKLPEVREIWSATYELGELWGPAIRLMILTAQRRREVLHLRASEIDFENRRIEKPGSLTKNGKPHLTHLSSPALDEVKALCDRVGNQSDYLFTTTGTTPVSGISKVKKRLDSIISDRREQSGVGPMEPWRLHDLRTAFATAMSDANVPESVADRVLNHSASSSAPSAVARVYNRSQQLPQRAAALDKWAEMVTDHDTTVVPFDRYGSS